MDMKFKNKYRIPSARLKGYDYSQNGAYFITICAKNMEHYFGGITGGEMVLSDAGIIAEKYWNEIPAHFPFAQLDAFAIMPNHIHGILLIAAPNEMTGAPTIGAIINQFKRICTITAKKQHIPLFWQSRFYDHIIRAEDEMNKIRGYIDANPQNWQNDENNAMRIVEGKK